MAEGKSIGDLKVNIGADTSNLNTSSEDAKRKLKSVAKGMESVVKASLKMGAALKRVSSSISSGFVRGISNATSKLSNYAKNITAVSTALTVFFVKAQSEAIDLLAKTADGLGITTEKLQALQHVGELTGSTAEEINKSLARMERRLGEVARIGGAGALALDDLGISIDEIIKMTPDKQLEALSAALVGVENQAVKASIANDIFGRSGLKMLKLMEELKDKGLDPAVKELDALGISINRVDAAKVEAANDAMLRFSKVIKGVFARLSIELAPMLEGVANLFLDWVKKSGGAENAIRKMVDFGVKAIGHMADAVEIVRRSFGTLLGPIRLVIAGFQSVSNALGVLMSKLKGEGGSFKDALKPLSDLGKDLAGNFDQLPSSKLKSFVDGVREQSQKAAEEVAKSVENTKRVGDFTSTFFKKKSEMVATANNNEIESFRESLRTQEESEIAHYESRLSKLQEFLNNRQITEQEAAEARMTIEQQHQAALTEIQNSAYQERAQFVSSSLQGQISNIQGAFRLITGSLKTESKKQFEVTKVASIASALVKGYESVTSSFAAGARIGGPPLGFAFAATAAAATAAQIGAIKAQQFNGGGSVAKVGGSSSGGVTTQSQQQVTQPQQRSIHITGVNPSSLFTGEQINKIIDGINDAVGDGAVLVSSGVIE